jgi:tetratricopeptide (TPR) repeat protein
MMRETQYFHFLIQLFYMCPMKKYLVIFSIFMLLVLPATAHVNSDVEQAIVLFQAQQYNAAKTLLEKALGTADIDGTIHYYLCRIHFALDSYDMASEHCKIAVQLQDNQPDYHFWLGRSYGAVAANANPLQQAALASKIRKAFEKTVALDPTHVQGRVGLVNFYLRAPAIMGGSLDKAYAHVQTLIGLDEIEGRLLLARFYEKTQQLEAAEAEYRGLQRRYGQAGKTADIYKQYGDFLLRSKRYEEAMQILSTQVALFPTRAAAYEQLGDGYSTLRRWSEAVEAYRTTLQLDPSAKAAAQKLHTTEKELAKLLGRK